MRKITLQVELYLQDNNNLTHQQLSEKVSDAMSNDWVFGTTEHAATQVLKEEVV